MAANQQGVIDGIQKLAGQIAQLQFEPDAQQHMPFIQGLQNAIVTYVQQQAAQAAQAATQAGQQAAQMGASGGGMGDAGLGSMGGAGGGGYSPGGAPPDGGLAPLGANQMQPGGGLGGGFGGLTTPPNPDELRRLLSQGAGR